MSTTTKCAQGGCKDKAKKGSKYCPTHKAESWGRMKEIFEQTRIEREERYALFAMMWEDAKNASTDTSVTVVVRPSTCSFAHWVVKQGHGVKSDADKGVVIRGVSEAFAAEIRKNDIRCQPLVPAKR